jgi:hypothetical protein
MTESNVADNADRDVASAVTERETSPLNNWIHQKRYWIVALAAALVVVLYAGFTALSAPGFPLDDSWIHQTYARNLVSTGRWEYAPGIVSNGSTSPIWTLLLSVGYLLRAPVYWWAYFMGWLCLVWLLFSAMALWKSLWPEYNQTAVWIGLSLSIAWPLVWAAASGMETVLFTALILQILVIYTRLDSDALGPAIGLGVLCSLAIATRPDGLVLTILVVAGLVISVVTRKIKINLFLVFGGAAFLVIIPYFLFNISVSGTWWPNTLYAKQAEYAFLWDQALPIRFIQLLYFSVGGPPSGLRGISGVQLLLLPGIVTAAVLAVRSDLEKRQLQYLLPLAWAAGHVFIYAWRLPVTYQHGRYLLPTIPIWFIFGIAGWKKMIEYFRSVPSISESTKSILVKGLILSFWLLALIFLVLGLNAYRQDVAFVNGEMVDVALWLNENTPLDAQIAAHDIGAIGYFAQRQLIDLAGLISPEVISFLDDESDVIEFIRESEADFLVTAPGWTYEELTNSDETKLLFVTELASTRDQGFNNMAVYIMKSK